MQQTEFDVGWEELCVEFEKFPKRRDKVFERLRHNAAADWLVAVEAIIEKRGERMGRGFPDTGELIHVLSQTRSARIQKADMDRKVREAQARQRLVENPELEGIGAILQRIPFPPALKAALARKIRGEVTQAEFEAECREWERDNRPPPGTPGGRTCLCEEGLVHYQRDGYWYAGACGVCSAGQAQPKAYPRTDPKTLTVLGEERMR